MDRVYYGLPTTSGVYINVDTALQVGAVWSCVQAYATTIASLPFILYRKLPNGGRDEYDDHRLYDLLRYQPNPEMTAREFWHTAIAHQLTWGNFFGHITVDDYGAREIWPLDPSKCAWRRDPESQGGKLWLAYKRSSSDTVRYEFVEIFHLKGFSLDGITGLSPIAYHRNAIGLASSAQEFGSRFFGNGSQPGGFLTSKGKLSLEAAKRLKSEWERLHAGPSNAHRVAVLEEGLTFAPNFIPADQSQFLQTIRATKEDIAAIYRVPPHKIGLLEHTNRASIEEQNIEWVIDSILPECVLIEQAVQRDLVNIGQGKRGVYAEFNVDALMRGNQAARSTWYTAGRQWGYFSADDVREMENKNPLPDGQGKMYLVPLNMTPADMVRKVVTAQIAKPDDQSPPAPAGTGPVTKVEDDPPDDAEQPGNGAPTPNGKANNSGPRGSIFRDLVPLTRSNGASNGNGRH